jgi:hypothetical protein
MPSFGKMLTAKDVAAIRAYLIARTQETAAKAAAGSQRR